MTDKSTVPYVLPDGTTIELSTYMLAKAIDYEQFAYLLDCKLNGSGSNHGFANAISDAFTKSHRTIQACFIRWCLWCINYYSTNYRNRWAGNTDARNEVALQAADIVRKLMDDGTIPNPPLI